MKFVLIGLILLYRYTLSYFIGRSCRFSPTCSEYGIETIKKYGAYKGGVMAVKRIFSCRPGGGSGYDPVP